VTTQESQATIPHGSQRAGTVVARSFHDWPAEVLQDFRDNAYNFAVGQRILSETEDVRVWEIRLDPGHRLPAHRHVLDYFWTAVSAGHSRQHEDDGTTREVGYAVGDTRHFRFGRGEYLLHDLENIGESQLVFVTVEHKSNIEQLKQQQR
jgi:hypothetical protein